MASAAQQPLLNGEQRDSGPRQVDVDVNRLINGDDARSVGQASQNEGSLPQER